MVRWLLPSACVEHVLGDLQERMLEGDPRSAPRRYILDALVTVPSVIFSRVVRGVDLRLAGLYLAAQGVIFLVLTFLCFDAPRFLQTARGLERILCFAIAAVALRLIQDAYRPLAGAPKFILFMAAFNVYFYFGESHHFLGAIWAIVFGDVLMTKARRIFEKHVSGRQDRRTS